MELLNQVSNTQFLFPAAAVAVVLVCAALVFMFGFHTAEQPQFDKLPLVLDDRKSTNKKKKLKEKKSSPNRASSEDSKPKNEVSKKSPTKEKKEDKAPEKPKPKEKTEPKVMKKEVAAEVKKGKKKAVVELEKPADFDDGLWEEVPKKSDKKKVKGPEEKEKKESPNKKNKKKVKDADVEAAKHIPDKEPKEEETIKVISAEGPDVDEDSTRALQAQVEELQRVLKEAEMRDQAAFGSTEEEDSSELTEVKDLRSNKKKENKEKQNKKRINEVTAATNAVSDDNEPVSAGNAEEKQAGGAVFDELGDTWTDAKVSKKSKKKARKDQ